MFRPSPDRLGAARLHLRSRGAGWAVLAVAALAVLALRTPLAAPVLLRDEATYIRTPALFGVLPALCWLPSLQISLGAAEDALGLTSLRVQHALVAGVAVLLPAVAFWLRVDVGIGMQAYANSLLFLGLILVQIPTLPQLPPWLPAVIVAAVTWMLGVTTGTQEVRSVAWLLRPGGSTVAIDVGCFVVGALAFGLVPRRNQSAD